MPKKIVVCPDFQDDNHYNRTATMRGDIPLDDQLPNIYK